MTYLSKLIKLFKKSFLEVNKTYNVVLHRLTHIAKIDEIKTHTYLFFEKTENKFSVSLLVKSAELNLILYENKNYVKYDFDIKTFNKICKKEILKNIRLIDDLKFSSYFGYFDIKSIDDILKDEKNFVLQHSKNANYRLSNDFCCVCYELTQSKNFCCDNYLCVRCLSKVKLCPLCRVSFIESNLTNNIFDTMLINNRENTENINVNLNFIHSDFQNLF